MGWIKIILFIALVFAFGKPANEGLQTGYAANNPVASVLCASCNTHALTSAKLPSMPEADLGGINHVPYYYVATRHLFPGLDGHFYYLYPCGWQSGKNLALAQRHKEYDDTDILAQSHPAGDYYVFAIRHILI